MPKKKQGSDLSGSELFAPKRVAPAPVAGAEPLKTVVPPVQTWDHPVPTCPHCGGSAMCACPGCNLRRSPLPFPCSFCNNDQRKAWLAATALTACWNCGGSCACACFVCSPLPQGGRCIVCQPEPAIWKLREAIAKGVQLMMGKEV